MFIQTVYERRYLVPEEHESNFPKKQKLSDIERVGLEAIAVEFIAQYETESFGEETTAERRAELRDLIRWNESNVDILDGYYDTYEFDGYLFGEVWSTENGIPMLTAWEIPEDCEDWTERDYMDEFKAVYFRLN